MCCASLKTGRIFSFLLIPVLVIYEIFFDTQMKDFLHDRFKNRVIIYDR